MKMRSKVLLSCLAVSGLAAAIIGGSLYAKSSAVDQVSQEETVEEVADSTPPELPPIDLGPLFPSEMLSESKKSQLVRTDKPGILQISQELEEASVQGILTVTQQKKAGDGVLYSGRFSEDDEKGNCTGTFELKATPGKSWGMVRAYQGGKGCQVKDDSISTAFYELSNEGELLGLPPKAPEAPEPELASGSKSIETYFISSDDGEANLRPEASTENTPLAVLQNGDSVSVVRQITNSSNQNWSLVKSSKGDGWIYSELLASEQGRSFSPSGYGRVTEISHSAPMASPVVNPAPVAAAPSPPPTPVVDKQAAIAALSDDKARKAAKQFPIDHECLIIDYVSIGSGMDMRLVNICEVNVEYVYLEFQYYVMRDGMKRVWDTSNAVISNIGGNSSQQFKTEPVGIDLLGLAMDEDTDLQIDIISSVY